MSAQVTTDGFYAQELGNGILTLRLEVDQEGQVSLTFGRDDGQPQVTHVMVPGVGDIIHFAAGLVVSAAIAATEKHQKDAGETVGDEVFSAYFFDILQGISERAFEICEAPRGETVALTGQREDGTIVSVPLQGGASVHA